MCLVAFLLLFVIGALSVSAAGALLHNFGILVAILLVVWAIHRVQKAYSKDDGAPYNSN